MLRSFSVYGLTLVAFFSFALFSASTEKEDSETTQKERMDAKNLPQVIRSINLNRSFSFAEEEVPIATNFDARERLDRELSRNAYYHSNTLLNIKRTSRYFPVIEKILAKNGVPEDFKYLAVAESDLTNATSPAGAKGIWQFMKPAARAYGLEINREVDERYHLEKATAAACKYLKNDKERFGSWTLAAAAYNMGGTRLRKELKAQRASSYYDLNLNTETMRYVFRIIALKQIINEPNEFGFYLEEGDRYQPLDFVNIKVDHSIANLGDFAQKNGISYRMLKVFNPWLIASSLTNKSGKTYYIKVPKM
ncbi:MAG: lytic transglycosylase domain-containing protein [Bacteroidota bacterium]